MAEAFGVGAGVVGVLSLTIQIAHIVVKFGSDWKDAPDEIRGFLAELQSLKLVLSETNTNLLDPDFKAAFTGQPSVLLNRLGPEAELGSETACTLEICERQLAMVLADLKKRSEASQFGWRRLKEPFLVKGTRDTIERVHRHCSIFNAMMSMDAVTLAVSTNLQVKAAREEQRSWHEHEEAQKILTWLSSSSFEQKQADVLARHHPGTGQWFMDHDDFIAWKNGVEKCPPVVWSPGHPGVGKTVMISAIIENLRQDYAGQAVSIAFVYCDYKDRTHQTTLSLLLSLVKQQVLQQKCMPQSVIELFMNYGQGQRKPSIEDATRLLELNVKSFRKNFVLVDALDEHLTEDTQSLSQGIFLDKLLALVQSERLTGHCRLLCTSRYNANIAKKLNKAVRIDISAAESDIETYTYARIGDEAQFRFADAVNLDPVLKERIARSVVDKAQGMFLLPCLHLDALHCEVNIRGVYRSLGQLPTKLDDSYDAAMTRIRGQPQAHERLAFDALSWISSAIRPLKVIELKHALAVQAGDSAFDSAGITDEAFLLSVTAGLVHIDTESDTIRLVHFTVEEYLRHKHQVWFPHAAKMTVETCLTYLSYDEFANGRCKSTSDLELRLSEYKFLDYAANNWGTHAQRAMYKVSPKLIDAFLLDDAKVGCAAQAMEQGHLSRSWYCPSGPSGVTGIHLVSYFGLEHDVRRLVDKGVNVNVADDFGDTPLFYAVRAGHEFFSSLSALTDGLSPRTNNATDVRGLDYDDQPQDGGLSLSETANSGQPAIVKLLLERADVQVDAQNLAGRTALSYAVIRGSIALVNLLLSRDAAGLNKPDCEGRTPLIEAAERGHLSILKVLLAQPSIEPEIQDGSGRTALLFATQNHDGAIVRCLLDQGRCRPNHQDSLGMTPLLYAIEERDHDVVRLLLGHRDIQPDTRNKRKETALFCAVQDGQESTVGLLLNRDDVAVNVQNVEGETPLIAAIKRRHDAIGRLLLSRPDIKPDIRDNSHRTALSHAAGMGCQSIVQDLLGRDDVDINSQDVNGQTPLCHATSHYHDGMSLLLRERGALMESMAKIPPWERYAHDFVPTIQPSKLPR